MFSLQVRKKIIVNTDPQRRCYNGCHYSSKEVWLDWMELLTYKKREDAIETMSLFQHINPERQYKVTP